MLRISLFECPFSSVSPIWFFSCVFSVGRHVGFLDYAGDEAVVI